MKTKNYLRALALVLSCILTLGCLTFAPQATSITASATTTINANDLVNYLTNLVGTTYPSGYCLAFVAECFNSLGATWSSGCCAYTYGSSHIISTDINSIPVGADVFFGNCGGTTSSSHRSSYGCSAEYYGHVGIYIGDGYFVHATGGYVQKTLISNSYWSTRFRGWGYHGNVSIGSSAAVGSSSTYNAVLPFKSYLKGTSTVYPCSTAQLTTTTGGEIWSTDECTITEVYTNGACKVTYPAGSSTKTAYTSLSNFIGDTSAIPTQQTASKQITAYIRADTSSTVYGYIYSGDTIYLLGTSGSMTQVFYPVSGYYKLAWVLTSELAVSASTNPAIHWWLSDSAYGEAVSSLTVGNRYYYCFQIYDSISGKDWDDVASSNYSVNIAVYNPDGTLNYEYTTSNDCGWLSIFYTSPGTYTMKMVITGDLVCDISKEFYVTPNPKEIHSSTSSVNLTLGGTSSTEIIVWTTGYHSNSATLSYSKSNNAISCSWGEWTDGKIPLYITANNVGSTTITLSVKDSDTSEILHSITVNVVVDSVTYRISYSANGGSGAPSSQTKTYGLNLTLSSSTPVRTGYTFLGWSTSSTATSATYKAGATFTANANTTLYAVWKANTYTISYSANGGSGAPSSQTKTYGVSLTLSSSTPVRTGYTFLGWSTSSTATSATYKAGATFTANANTTLYAVWKANTYTISYNANGGSGAPSSQTKTYGVNLTLSSSTPTRTGYTFIGWSTSSTATSATYKAGATFTANANTTLYAVWTKNASIGDANGDGVVNSIDAALILKYVAGSTTFSATQLLAADYNGDGVVNSIDAALILKHSAGF